MYSSYYVKEEEEKISENSFVILRDESLVNEFDKSRLTKFDNFHSVYQLEKFFEFERYPKLRDCSWNSKNVDEIFYKRQFMLVFIPKEEEEPEKDWEFEKAVQYLPKRMIYSKCAFNDP